MGRTVECSSLYHRRRGDFYKNLK